jgi:hypothetical protein
MTGKKSRDKGNREERDVVNLLRNLGFTHAERTLERGARSDGSPAWDIDLPLSDENNTTLRGECKIRKSGFASIYGYLANNDFLTIRANNQKRLWVLSEETLILLLGQFLITKDI